MIRVAGLKLTLEEEEAKLPFLAAKKLGLKMADIQKWHIFKQSIDARRHGITFVYTLDVALKDEAYIISKHHHPDITYTPSYDYTPVHTGQEKLSAPPIIVGAGPAGLFAALLLAQMGYQPIVLERGEDVHTRWKRVTHFWNTGELDPASNVQFGEGGAGTFSDGKLTTLIKDPRSRRVLKDLVQAGAPPEILYTYRPHVGTDLLREVVVKLRQHIQDLGGHILFKSCVTDLRIANHTLTGVIVNHRDCIPCQALVLAIGHSARDTYTLLDQKKIEMSAKPFSIGVRIEHPQELINRIQYKELAGHPKLGAADYKLAYHSAQGRSAYTFCMCPGGVVVAAASEAEGVVTNGMSHHARSGHNANSALLVGVTPQDFPGTHPLAGLQFQREWEGAAYRLGGGGFSAPAQLAGDFLAARPSTAWGSVLPSYPRGLTPTDLRGCLPPYVTTTLRDALLDFNRRMPGFAQDDAVLTGVETRSSSPVRILRGANHESNIHGLYPAGEGAGYAGGIISAAVDGLKTAEALAQQYQPLSK